MKKIIQLFSSGRSQSIDKDHLSLKGNVVRGLRGKCVNGKLIFFYCYTCVCFQRQQLPFVRPIVLACSFSTPVASSSQFSMPLFSFFTSRVYVSQQRSWVCPKFHLPKMSSPYKTSQGIFRFPFVWYVQLSAVCVDEASSISWVAHIYTATTMFDVLLIHAAS